MLLKEWMSKTVITIDQEESLTEAARLFQTRVISMLPVLKNGSIEGIVTDGDIKRALPSDATTLDKFEMGAMLDDVKIKSVMSSPAETILLDRTVYEAAGTMLRKGISGMPVLEQSGKLTGIITKSDIFRCFVSFAGVTHNGQIFAFQLKDKPGVIKRISDVIRSSNGRLCSILTAYDDIEDGFRKVFFNAFDIDKENFNQLVENFLKSENLIYAADLKRNIRQIYSR